MLIVPGCLGTRGPFYPVGDWTSYTTTEASTVHYKPVPGRAVSKSIMWVSAPPGNFFFLNWGYAHRPKHRNTVLSEYQPPVLSSRALSPGPRGNGKWISLAFPGGRASQMETQQEENCPQEPLAHPSLVHPFPLPTLALPKFPLRSKIILHTASPNTSCSPYRSSIPSGTLTSPRGSRWDSHCSRQFNVSP